MSSDPSGSSTNVLVVEDEMVLRLRAVDIVEDAGFTAIEAANADQALSILESRSDISLLFSDIQMPGQVQLDYRPAGFAFLLEVQLDSLTAKA
jgi:CheY-like chemotaxis protein